MNECLLRWQRAVYIALGGGVATCSSRTNGGKGRKYRERWENWRAMSCEGEMRGDSGTTGNKYTGKEGDDRGDDGITGA
jgi:hypothetical protein